MKCSRRGAKKKGFWREGQRETWTGFKVPRRSEQLEVKSALGGVRVSCDCACTCLYTAAYLLACLKQTCRRTCINITCKNKHLPMQLTVSTLWNEIIPQTKTLKLFSFLKITGMHLLNVRNPYSNLDNGYDLVIWLSPCSMHELWWKLDKCRTFTTRKSKREKKKHAQGMKLICILDKMWFQTNKTHFSQTTAG